MTKKLDALIKINKKITEIQKQYRIRFNFIDNESINLEVPNDNEFKVVNKYISDNMQYKKIKLHNEECKNIVFPLMFVGERGCLVRKHTHNESHLFFCLEGKLKFTVENKIKFLNKEESIFIDSLQEHEIEFLENSKLMIIYF